jgi:hypothetical protein
MNPPLQHPQFAIYALLVVNGGAGERKRRKVRQDVATKNIERAVSLSVVGVRRELLPRASG